MNNENELLKMVKLGNEQALEKLINQNEGLIWSGVQKFLGKGVDAEDLYQIACLGFIKAVKRFNENLGYKLSTFAVPYIVGEIKKFFRDDGIIKVSRELKKMGVKFKIESINEKFFEDEKAEKQDFLESKEDEQEKLINKITIKNMIDKLKLRDKKIIKLRFYDEKTQTQVAKMLGISQVQVSRLERKILKNMKLEII